LKLAFDDPEYAVWVLLRNRGFTGRIRHVYVENESARLENARSTPCAILTGLANVPASGTSAFPQKTRHGDFTLLRPAAVHP